MVKDSFYFPHDSNARSDPAIITIRRKYGWEGYGSYFGIIEFLREQHNYRVSLERSDDCLFELRIKPEIFEDLFNVGLLKKDDKTFFSESLLRRMEHIDGVRNKRREAGRAGGKTTSSKSETNAKQMLEQNQSKSEANAQAIKGKESKGKENKDNEKASPISFPVCLDTQEFRKSWDEWKQYRRERKKPMTATGEQKTLEALAKFGQEWAIERINKSISAGWQGLVFDNDKPEAIETRAKLPPGQIQVVL